MSPIERLARKVANIQHQIQGLEAGEEIRLTLALTDDRRRLIAQHKRRIALIGQLMTLTPDELKRRAVSLVGQLSPEHSRLYVQDLLGLPLSKEDGQALFGDPRDYDLRVELDLIMIALREEE